MHYGSGMNWDDGSWWMVAAMTGATIIILALVVVAIVFALRSTRTVDRSSPERSNELAARAVLDLRYARGEIDTAEYEERSSKLVG